MGKEQFFEVRAKIEVAEEDYKRIKELGIELDFKGYYCPALKDFYKENPEWLAYTQTIREAFEERQEIESEIRVQKNLEQWKTYLEK